MWQENLEVVRGIQPAPDVDLAALFRDDTAWAALSKAVAPLFDQDFKAGMRTFDRHPPVLQGLEGLRSVWLDWLQPWASYRTEIQEVIDIDDKRVLVLAYDSDGRPDSEAEVRFTGTT